MVQSSEENFVINEKYWYYVDLKNPLKPRVVKDFYEFKSEIVNIMDKYLKNRKRYFAVRGALLKPYESELWFKKRPFNPFAPIDDDDLPEVNSQRRRQRLYLRDRRIRMKKARELGVYKVGKQAKKKYEYPDWCQTRREKKTFRELERRKMWKRLKAFC